MAKEAEPDLLPRCPLRGTGVEGAATAASHSRTAGHTRALPLVRPADALSQPGSCHSVQDEAEPGHEKSVLSFTGPFGKDDWRLVVEVRVAAQWV
jgi:hypothetical protein